jgi:hypothetical protein
MGRREQEEDRPPAGWKNVGGESPTHIDITMKLWCVQAPLL